MRLVTAQDRVQRSTVVPRVWSFQHASLLRLTWPVHTDDADPRGSRCSFRCYYHGKTFTLFPPHIPLTSSNIVRIIASSPTRPEQHFAVPYVLKMLAETEEGTRCLAGFEAVSFAGAAVPDDLGDRLVQAGVNLFSVYGTTGEYPSRRGGIAG